LRIPKLGYDRFCETLLTSDYRLLSTFFMKSMTGFGRGAATGENFSAAVDIKTVNNRFLDIHLRLGGELSPLESEVKRRIGARLARGRVDVTVTFERTGDVAYEINHGLIAGFVSAMRSLQTEFGLAGEPDINVIARLPNALQPVRDGIDSTATDGIHRALEQALSELEQMRAREGDELAAEMRARLDEIAAQIPLIESSAGAVADGYRARLEKRINELMGRDGAGELDQNRLAQEVAYLADRSDITEEITRLKSHMVQFREIIDSDGEVGKRLDFLLQELNREANTVLSKATDISIKEAGLTIKSAVEKIREQVQNVE
jgi:uncharacterized protein (TIGR00255 family)